MKELNTTSYALLGLLGIRPWSAYELAQQMQRGFAWLWPRAERAIYQEPKHLVAHGLATSRIEQPGRQRRTMYEITPAGRAALRTWLAEPSSIPRFESESLVRLTFLEQGDPADAAAALDALKQATEQLRTIAATVSSEYRRDSGPFPDRLPEVVLGGHFLLDLADTFDRYRQWAASFVERTVTDGADSGSTKAIRDELAALHRRATRRH